MLPRAALPKSSNMKKTKKWVNGIKDEGAVVLEGINYSGLEEKIKQAAEACPVEVIKYDEDDDLKNAQPPINRSMGDWD